MFNIFKKKDKDKEKEIDKKKGDLPLANVQKVKKEGDDQKIDSAEKKASIRIDSLN